MRKYIASALLMLLISQTAFAQSGTNSPYSQYGLGEIADQTSGFNRGMNGLGLGFREGNQVNFKNPASYSSLDSLTFIFDVGVSGQITNFKENGVKKNANNADFEYALAGFRLFRHLGLSFGILPYTNVGYSYSSSQDVNDANSTTATTTYSGSGGLHQIYLGLGWEPFRGFSIGINGGYLYGDLDRSVVTTYSDASAYGLEKVYSAEVRSYLFNAGLQYTARLSKKDKLTIGLTYGLGHKIGGDPTVEVSDFKYVTSSSGTSAVGIDTLSFPTTGKYKLAIPHEFGAGFLYDHEGRYRVGADYQLQKWSDTEYPVYTANASNASTYVMSKDYFKDRHKITVGGEVCPNPRSRSFLKRIRYRAGVSYATSYYYIDGQDGPKELSASIGFGIPIINGYNNRSILNISGQWVHRSATDYITENTFRINIGLTFNERWFDKWKVE